MNGGCKALLGATASLALLGAAGCATTGSILPTSFTIAGNDGPQIDKVAGQASARGGSGAILAAGADAQGRGQSQVYEAEALSAYLENFLETRLLTHWPYERPARIRVLVKASSATDYNLWAYPDNTIVMTVAVLEKYSSDDALAYALAHEFAHIVLGHADRIEDNIATNQLSSALSSMYLITSALSQTEVSSTGSGANFQMQVNAPADSDLAQSRKQAQDGLVAMRYANDVLLSSAWGRNQEDEADAIAADLLVRAGFNLEAGEQFFEDMTEGVDWRAETQQRTMQAFNTSLTTTLSPQNISAAMGGDSTVVDSAVDNLKDELGVAARELLRGYLAQGHRPPEQRREGIARYLTNAYGGAPSDAEPTYDAEAALYDNVRRGTPACDLVYILEARDVVYEARKWEYKPSETTAGSDAASAAASGAVNQVAANLLTSLTTPGGAAAAPQQTGPTPAEIAAQAAAAAAQLEADHAMAYAMLKTYQDTGRADVVDNSTPQCPSVNNPVSRSAFYQAAMAQFAPDDQTRLRHFTNAVNGAYPEPIQFAEKAALEVQLGLLTDAQRTIDTGTAVFGDPNFFYPEKILLASARGNFTEAVSLHSACRGIERIAVEERCSAALMGVDLDTLTEQQKAEFAAEIAKDSDNPGQVNQLQEGLQGLQGLFNGQQQQQPQQ